MRVCLLRRGSMKAHKKIRISSPSLIIVRPHQALGNPLQNTEFENAPRWRSKHAATGAVELPDARLAWFRGLGV